MLAGCRYPVPKATVSRDGLRRRPWRSLAGLTQTMLILDLQDSLQTRVTGRAALIILMSLRLSSKTISSMDYVKNASADSLRRMALPGGNFYLAGEFAGPPSATLAPARCRASRSCMGFLLALGLIMFNPSQQLPGTLFGGLEGGGSP